MAYIKHQKKGDQQIDTPNFNRIADGADKAQKLKFDQKFFQQVNTGKNILITMKDIRSDLQRMFDIEISGNTFRYRPGVWIRSGCIGATKLSANPVPYYDPVSAAVITGTGTERVYVYAVLASSDCKDILAFVNTMDLRNDSSFWTSASAKGVYIVIKSEPVADAVTGSFPTYRADPFDQWKLLGTLDYNGGTLTDVVQLHRGPILQDDPVFITDDGFRTCLDYEGVADYNKTLTAFLRIKNGDYERRNNTGTITGVTLNYATVQSDNYVAYLGPSTINWTVDPSLEPYSPEIAVDNGGTETYAFYQKFLCGVIKSVDGDSQNWIKLVIWHSGGDWDDDWVRPDGIDIGGLGAANIDTGYDRIASLDFVSSGAHKGELQIGQAWELVANASGIGNISGDQVFPFIEYVAGGKSLMNYGRADVVNAAAWLNCGESVGVNANQVLELRQFYSAFDGILSPVAPIGSWFTNRSILIRDNRGTYPELRYADLSDFFHDDVWHPDWCNEIENCDWFREWFAMHHDEMDPSTGTGTYGDWALNPDHDGRYWKHSGASGPAESGTFYTSGECRAVIFALMAPDNVGNYWRASGFNVLVDAVDIKADVSTLVLTAATILDLNGVTVDIDSSTNTHITAVGFIDVDGASFDFDTSGAMDFLAGTTMTLKSAGNFVFESTGGNVDVDASGTVDVEAGNNLTMSAILAASVTTTSGDITFTSGAWINLVAAGSLDLAPAGDLLFNGNVGATLADGVNNVFEKGGFVNDGPAYSIIGIRVLPAGGGAPFDMNVIGRAT